jgi:GH25 family lysozyme M1 (1,4-beta-N-acetylmuramidase)
VYHGDDHGSLPNFNELKKNGVQFMFVKATQGQTVDPELDFNWNGAKNAGMIVGAYDFYEPTKDAATQAQTFLKALPPLRKGDLVALDLEEDPNKADSWSKVPQADRIKGVLTWLNIVEKQLNIVPIIYSSRDFIGDTFGKDAAALKDYPFWLAEYNVPRPTVRPPFANADWWQFTETGTFPGLAGHQNDLNVYLGSTPLPSLATSLRLKESQKQARLRADRQRHSHRSSMPD